MISQLADPAPPPFDCTVSSAMDPDHEMGSELAYSMLNAAESMQRLTDELDRISLPPDDVSDSNTSRHPRKKKQQKKGERPSDLVPYWTPECTSEMTQFLWHKEVLDAEDSRSELSSLEQPPTPSGVSNASSKFDSAFGSQTDADSVNSQSLNQLTVPPNDDHSEPVLTQHLALQDLLYSSSRTTETSHISPCLKDKQRHHRHKSASRSSALHAGAASDTPSPQPASLHRKKKKHHTTNRKTSTTSQSPSRGGSNTQQLYAHESWYLEKGHSTQSHSSSSSSLYEPRVLAAHNLTLSRKSPADITDQTPPVKVPEHKRGRQYGTHHYDSDSSNSTTPTVSASEREELGPTTASLPPEMIVDSQVLLQHGSAWEQLSAQKEKNESTKQALKPPGKHKSLGFRVNGLKEDNSKVDEWTTRFYQDNITPQPSPKLSPRYHQHTPQLPRRYRETGTSVQQVTSVQEPIHPPKRSASILQRLKKRRYGSFRYERKPRRRLPVKRAFSDRITYHIRKGWVDYDEDLELISTPSRPRPIGRMVDTHAGRYHIVELHKPPNGRYGIYISEGGAFRKGIFVSRFAEGVAAKFYSGLLSPGDEIIKVNGQPVQDKSLDYVYNILASLESVLLVILPVSARSDWC